MYASNKIGDTPDARHQTHTAKAFRLTHKTNTRNGRTQRMSNESIVGLTMAMATDLIGAASPAYLCTPCPILDRCGRFCPRPYDDSATRVL